MRASTKPSQCVIFGVFHITIFSSSLDPTRNRTPRDGVGNARTRATKRKARKRKIKSRRVSHIVMMCESNSISRGVGSAIPDPSATLLFHFFQASFVSLTGYSFSDSPQILSRQSVCSYDRTPFGYLSAARGGLLSSVLSRSSRVRSITRPNTSIFT